MKRLTQELNGQHVAKFDIWNYNEDNKVMWLEYSRSPYTRDYARYLTGKIAEKLFVYEDAEENGRLLFLPERQNVVMKLLVKVLRKVTRD